MAWLTQLFVVPSSSTATQQLTTLEQAVVPEVRALFGTVDLKVINRHEEEDTFTPLKIEQVRDIQLEVAYGPLQHAVRGIVIGNLELASLPAQQALLKLLEEPPEYVQVLVTTAELSSLLPTILSRCQVIKPAGAPGEISTKQLEFPSELNQALDALPRQALSLKTAFQLSDCFKERPDAISFVQTMITSIHQSSTYPTVDLIRVMQKCQATLQLLKKNVNARLAIEELLFEFVRKN